MTKRETVVNVLNHKDTPVVPYEIGFTIPQREKMIKYLGDPDFESKIGGYLYGTEYNSNEKELPEKPGYFQDEHGVIWNRSGADKDIGTIDNYVIPEPDISLIPDELTYNEGVLRNMLQSNADNAGERFSIGGLGFSLFERMWTLTGFENALLYMAGDPGFVHALLDRICEFNLKIIDICGEYPLDAMQMGDDWGQQKGLIMGPEHWRRYIKPRLARMYERIHSQGRYVIQHSCGDILTIYPDLIDIGLNCHQTFQPEIFDIEYVKAEYGSDLTFYGGISTQTLLPYATPEEVASETRRIMDIMSKGGGYIAAPTHAIPYDVPPENVMAMIEVLQNQ